MLNITTFIVNYNRDPVATVGGIIVAIIFMGAMLYIGYDSIKGNCKKGEVESGD